MSVKVEGVHSVKAEAPQAKLWPLEGKLIWLFWHRTRSGCISLLGPEMVFVKCRQGACTATRGCVCVAVVTGHTWAHACEFELPMSMNAEVTADLDCRVQRLHVQWVNHRDEVGE